MTDLTDDEKIQLIRQKRKEQNEINRYWMVLQDEIRGLLFKLPAKKRNIIVTPENEPLFRKR